MTIVSPQRGWCGVSRETKNLPVGIVVGCQILGDVGAQQLLRRTGNTVDEHYTWVSQMVAGVLSNLGWGWGWVVRISACA